ncbi:hypothetical protein P170DRAFT_476980 [Aspergillus steynii IBT 23096]|uniref:F-box domain-containing protein n=1 Tax=Aspergillus steynii IBT 23096 TaxID=1392250 RepID=A0A2I2G676_9EURO|nr:uncharacterized protein P170DRAFT_476980 [Aspergillus steynii IBT 23096]PLB48363.1 hypothetical protein P170DRAFT_476980 [Aspergillus steynii IBT 23096]
MDPGIIVGIDSLPVELLEMILLQLGMQFLLVTAQRVCQKWETCIHESLPIQQKLFYKALPESEPIVCNPLLAEFFPFFIPPWPGPGSHGWPYDACDPEYIKTHPKVSSYVRRRARETCSFGSLPSDPYIGSKGKGYLNMARTNIDDFIFHSRKPQMILRVNWWQLSEFGNVTSTPFEHKIWKFHGRSKGQIFKLGDIIIETYQELANYGLIDFFESSNELQEYTFPCEDGALSILRSHRDLAEAWGRIGATRWADDIDAYEF